MKYLAIGLVILLTLFNGRAAAQTSCTHTIEAATTDIEGTNIQPGDTICLVGGNKAYLYMHQLVGTAAQPIVIRNFGSAVVIDTDHFFGIKFSHCKHVKLIGNQSNGSEYGIQIKRVQNGAGISVDELSSNIEIAWVEVSNTKVGGIYAKTDPDCSFVATREKFTLYGLHIHHCFLHDIGDEGMYIGSSKYTGQHLTDCDTIVLPHLLHDVRIHDNLVENTGWDGIQVSSSPVDCFIYNNIIRHDSHRETPNQMSGILIGGGSDCDCYNNQIFDGKGDGIDVFGFGEMKIYNNLIVRAGQTFEPANPNAFRHGIFIGNAPDSAQGRLKIMHNTIIAPKTTGVRFFNSFTSNNLFFNNIITNPGAFATLGNNAYFNVDGSNTSITSRQNFFTETPQNIGFSDYQGDDFDLLAASGLVNKGFNAGLNNVSFDVLNRPRPHNGASDIGAFECQAVNAFLSEQNTEKVLVFPQPATDKLHLVIPIKLKGTLRIKLIDIGGKIVYDKPTYSATTDELIGIDVDKLPAGIYTLQLENAQYTQSQRIIIQ